MKEFEALKNIWDRQPEHPQVDPEDILKRVRKSKRSFSNKLLFETIGILVIIILLAIIWIKSPFFLWTTHLSMLIIMSCCFYYLFFQFRDYRSIKNRDPLLKQPEQYIEYLKTYKKRRYILNTRKYTIYSLFIGIAFLLYFIEVYFIATLWQTILGLILTIGWFIMCWFLMRTYSKREEEKLGNMIENLERLKKQFED
jgi:Flp pilus assembly protein TadB